MNEQRQIVESPLPSVGTVANFVVRSAKKHYVISLSWVLGILICLFATGYTPSQESIGRYNAKINTLNHEKLLNARIELSEIREEYYHSKGWFSCDDYCQTSYKHLQETEAKVNTLLYEHNLVLSNAKKEIGLLSNQGTEEARLMFWSYFGWGKDMAKRMSWYDMIFSGMSSIGRDEGIAGFLLRMLLNIFINFTISLLSALVAFVFALWGLIRSYQPDFLSAVFFFMCASLGAATFVFTWIGGLALGTVSAVVGTASLLVDSRRIEYQQRRGVQYQQYQQQQYRRAHAD